MDHVEDVTPQEEEKRYSQKEFIDAMQYVEFFPAKASPWLTVETPHTCPDHQVLGVASHIGYS